MLGAKPVYLAAICCLDHRKVFCANEVPKFLEVGIPFQFNLSQTHKEYAE